MNLKVEIYEMMIFHKPQRICWQIELDGNVAIQIVEKPHVEQGLKKLIL